MYAKEMRHLSRRDVQDDVGGGGDGLTMKSVDRDNDDDSPTGSDTEHHDDFAIAYGNYGNPYSFAPFQLGLLLIDFILNWTMDLTYEYPLAVLVIFIFQSLAIIINLILYIMASASQAMQVGVQRRVTIHHWLNSCVCLGYISLTGWWFIWALRKSWPSVSDQFSFTWPGSELEDLERSSIPSPAPPPGFGLARLRLRSAANSTGPGNNFSTVKEHYSLWSPGFNALYVVHRTLAIIYYFTYIRATFLVLNTPAMTKFIERKKCIVQKFEEAKKVALAGYGSCGGSDEGGGDLRSISPEGSSKRLKSAMAFPPLSSVMSIGLDEYISDKAYSNYFMEDEGMTKTRAKRDKRQILWADDPNANDILEGPRKDATDPTPVPKPRPKKRSSKKGEGGSKRSKKRDHKSKALNDIEEDDNDDDVDAPEKDEEDIRRRRGKEEGTKSKLKKIRRGQSQTSELEVGSMEPDPEPEPELDHGPGPPQPKPRPRERTNKSRRKEPPPSDEEDEGE